MVSSLPTLRHTLSRPASSDSRCQFSEAEKPSARDTYSINDSIYDGSTLRNSGRSSAFSFAPSIRSSATACSSSYADFKTSSKGISIDSTPVVRMGFVNVKEETFISLSWTRKWLVLGENSLAFHKNETSLQKNVIYLHEITNVERTDHRACCLSVDTKDKRTFISFQSDAQLYEWQDDIYSRSLVGASRPTNFVHKFHASFNPLRNAFTGLPEQWTRLLTRSANNTRNPNEVFLEDLKFYTPTSNTNRNSLSIVRTGQASVKEETFASLFWIKRWLVLSEDTLSFHKDEGPPRNVIHLRDVINVERTDRKTYCLSLETKNKHFFLSFENDEELYDWQEDIYSRFSLVGISYPTRFVHNVHVGFDPCRGVFTGLPGEWEKLLAQSTETEGENPRNPSVDFIVPERYTGYPVEDFGDIPIIINDIHATTSMLSVANLSIAT